MVVVAMRRVVVVVTGSWMIRVVVDVAALVCG